MDVTVGRRSVVGGGGQGLGLGYTAAAMVAVRTKGGQIGRVAIHRKWPLGLFSIHYCALWEQISWLLVWNMRLKWKPVLASLRGPKGQFFLIPPF